MEIVVNDWSGFLSAALDSSVGVGGTVSVTPVTPGLAAAHLGKTARARVGTEIVSVTLTTATGWTIIAREAEDATRYPKQSWPANTPVDLVLTEAGAAALPTTVPTGGASGTFLKKNSATNYDAVWFDLFGTANTFTVGPQTLRPGAIGAVGLVVKGQSGQTANLQEWQNSVGVNLAFVTAAGIVQAASFNGPHVGDGSALTNLPVDLLSPLAAAEISITGATTATLGRMHVCSGTTADYTVTLPAASGNAGKLIGFRMATGLTKLVTLDGNGTETIDGATTRIMWAGESAVLLCDGSNWFKVAGKTLPMFCTMRLAAHQTGVVTATVTKVQLDTSVTDNTGRMADTTNKRAVTPRPGQWRASASVCVGGTSGGAALAANAARVLTRLHFNGSVCAQAECSALSGSYPTPFLSKSQPGAGTLTDNFELNGYQDTGSNGHFYGGAGQETHLSIVEEPSW